MQGAVVETSSFIWIRGTNIVVPLVRSVSLRACFPAITSARCLVLRLFLPAAPEVAHERPAVTGKLGGGHLRQGQLSFQRRHQPWFRSASSPARAGGSCTPGSRPAGPRGGGGPGSIALSWRWLTAGCRPAARPASSASIACMCARIGTCAGEPGVIRPRFARSWRLAVSSSAVVSWLTSRAGHADLQDAVDDLAAARREEVGPFLAQRADEHQAPAAFGVVAGAGQGRRGVVGVVDLDEQVLAEMPQGQRYQAGAGALGIPQRARGIAGEPHRVGHQLRDEQFCRLGCVLADSAARIQERAGVPARPERGRGQRHQREPAGLQRPGHAGPGGCQAEPGAGPISAVTPLRRAMACPVIAGYLPTPLAGKAPASLPMRPGL